MSIHITETVKLAMDIVARFLNFDDRNWDRSLKNIENKWENFYSAERQKNLRLQEHQRI